MWELARVLDLCWLGSGSRGEFQPRSAVGFVLDCAKSPRGTVRCPSRGLAAVLSRASDRLVSSPASDTVLRIGVADSNASGVTR